jgi:hypothetical protein
MNGAMTSHSLGSRRSLPRRPGRVARLRARLNGSALDRDLASGIAPWRSPAHAARALQLTSARRREAYADGLERVLAETERPSHAARVSGAVLADPGAVILCAPVMWEIVGELRGAGPVSAEGMARLRSLLCDGAGPLYCAGQHEELCEALEHIARWLPVAT